MSNKRKVVKVPLVDDLMAFSNGSTLKPDEDVELLQLQVARLRAAIEPIHQKRRAEFDQYRLYKASGMKLDLRLTISHEMACNLFQAYMATAPLEGIIFVELNENE